MCRPVPLLSTGPMFGFPRSACPSCTFCNPVLQLTVPSNTEEPRMISLPGSAGIKNDHVGWAIKLLPCRPTNLSVCATAPPCIVCELMLLPKGDTGSAHHNAQAPAAQPGPQHPCLHAGQLFLFPRGMKPKPVFQPYLLWDKLPVPLDGPLCTRVPDGRGWEGAEIQVLFCFPPGQQRVQPSYLKDTLVLQALEGTDSQTSPQEGTRPCPRQLPHRCSNS